jgi:tRNA modification GTPase
MRRSVASGVRNRKRRLKGYTKRDTMSSVQERRATHLTMPHVIRLTPPGRGAIATLRIEGPGAIGAVQSLFRSRNGRPLSEFQPHRLVMGHFGGEGGEEVVVRRHEHDAVDLHCHGGVAAVGLIEEKLIAAGCQPIAWRDWVTDQHDDPIAAAALRALADAPTERTAAILLDQYQGALGRAMDAIRQEMRQGGIDEARGQIDLLLARAELGRHLTRPWRVVLAGRVNVGKSSLINAMAGYGRSIVHPAPGTTRDAVTLTAAIDGWPVELCDTAGLRGSEDAVELAGIQLARQRLDQSDLAILVFDRSQPWSAEDQTLLDQWPDALLVQNKCDLPPGSDARPEGVLASALRGDGVDGLLEAIARRLVPDPPPAGAAVPFTGEQIETLKAF